MLQGGFYITYPQWRRVRVRDGVYRLVHGPTCRMAPSSAPRQAAALPGTEVGIARPSQLRSRCPFSPSIGNAAVIFDFPLQDRQPHAGTAQRALGGHRSLRPGVEYRGAARAALGHVHDGVVRGQPRHSPARHAGAFQPAQSFGAAVWSAAGRQHSRSRRSGRRIHAALSRIL